MAKRNHPSWFGGYLALGSREGSSFSSSFYIEGWGIEGYFRPREGYLIEFYFHVFFMISKLLLLIVLQTSRSSSFLSSLTPSWCFNPTFYNLTSLSISTPHWPTCRTYPTCRTSLSHGHLSVVSISFVAHTTLFVEDSDANSQCELTPSPHAASQSHHLAKPTPFSNAKRTLIAVQLKGRTRGKRPKPYSLWGWCLTKAKPRHFYHHQEYSR